MAFFLPLTLKSFILFLAFSDNLTFFSHKLAVLCAIFNCSLISLSEYPCFRRVIALPFTPGLNINNEFWLSVI